MDHIVSKEWLLARLFEPDLLLADCRFLLDDPNAGHNRYTEERIPGAVYFDLEKDLSGPLDKHGGRHPLPDIDKLAETFGKAGIDESVRVVAYDDQGGAMASRLWWLLRYLGHDSVWVLEDGFSAWKKSGLPVTDDPVHVQVPKTFTKDIQSDFVADKDDVQHALEADSAILLDSRDPERYAGTREPTDRVAGHIPKAQNRFWKGNLEPDGRWKTKEERIEQFKDLDKEQEYIVYCGSGVTACVNILSMYECGFGQVKLYPGSWSDWISYPDHPVATDEG